MNQVVVALVEVGKSIKTDEGITSAGSLSPRGEGIRYRTPFKANFSQRYEKFLPLLYEREL